MENEEFIEGKKAKKKRSWIGPKRAGLGLTLATFLALSGPHIQNTLNDNSGYSGKLRDWYNQRWGTLVCEAENQCKYIDNNTTRFFDSIDGVVFAHYDHARIEINGVVALALGGLTYTGLRMFKKNKKNKFC